MERQLGPSVPRTPPPGAPSLLAPIHGFGSGCFFVFGFLYLLLLDSPYMFFSNLFFGTLGVASWFLLRRVDSNNVRASVFLAIVYAGLVNVAIHVGVDPLPMVFWGMSISIAAAFLFTPVGVVTWVALSLGFYPLTSWLKALPLSGQVIPLDGLQTGVLSFATYLGLLSFLAFTFVLFRRRLDRALGVLQVQSDELRRNEAFLAEAQQVARIGTYDFDVQAGLWTSSPLMDEIFGLDPSARKDFAAWVALIHPDDRAGMERYFVEEVLGRGALFDREYRLARTENGRPVWVHGRGVVHVDANGRPQRVFGTIQDVTAAKCEEEDRRQLEAGMFNAQKLESLGVLAGGIAHDFNNLLTGILGNVTLARSELPPDRPQIDAVLSQAETSALRAAELTRQMLAFSGKGQFVVQPLDVNLAITELVDLLAHSVSKKVVMHFDLSPRRPRIMGDASQIRQVVMNLIINAAEAIGDHPGVITLRSDLRRVDRDHSAPGMTTGSLADGEYVSIEVIDTGCGMNDETQARLFDPFFTTKFTGRGLGLAAVLGIVKGHRGSIQVKSAPGAGTTFTLLLPSQPDEIRVESPPERAVPPVRDSRGVLVIDDEPGVRALVRTVLERSGFHVLDAADGAEGLETYRAHRTEIDMVLLDLTMPRMGGGEVFRELKQLDPAVRIVLMSGYTRGNVLKMFSDGAPDDFLEKPFHHNELVTIVRATLPG